MNTQHISSILSNVPGCSGIFKAVLPRDHFIQQQIAYPSLYVCNTDNSDKPGSHWVAVYFTKNKNCEYFDSYGLQPLFTDIHHKLLTIDSHYTYNESNFQGLNSNVCGMYCIVFAVMRCHGYSMRDVANLLLSTKNTEERDHVIKYFIESKYSKLLSSLNKLPPIHCVNESLCQHSLHRCITADVCDYIT